MRRRASKQSSAALFTGALLGLVTPLAVAGQPATIPAEFKRYFEHYEDRRSISEKILNSIGLSNQDVGRSFALIAGVDSYPKLPLEHRTLAPAAVDLEYLKSYLRDFEYFDEIVVLRNEAVTDDNFKFFFQAYFPERLRSFPKSRFLFAYSGHGIQDGPRGYLLQARATSFEDKANAINLGVLATIYRETAEAAFQSLALINACHSGAFIRRSFGNRRLLSREPGAHAITAGAGNELTWSLPDVGPGSLFFEKLFAGLDGRADTQPQQANGGVGDGVITASEIFAYLDQEVQLETDQRQHPLLGDVSADQSTGSFFFLNRRRQVAEGTVVNWTARRRELGAMPAGVKVPQLSWLDQGWRAFDHGNDLDATRLWERGCAAAELLACAELGKAYLYGSGNHLPRDEAKAAALYQRVCEAGEQRGCVYWGRALVRGELGSASDLNLGAHLLQQACDRGEMMGCDELAFAHLLGSGGLRQDSRRALALYERACAGGLRPSCRTAESMKDPQPRKRDQWSPALVTSYREECRRGDMEACGKLGDAYASGLGGVTENPAEAAALHREACEGGSMRSCFELAWTYWHGKALPQDIPQALALFRKACDGGQPGACFALAKVYEGGEDGLAVDLVRAKSLYQLGCAGDIEPACRGVDRLMKLGY